jgi:hypothetical protein
VLKETQAGRLMLLNLNVLPSGSDALGLNTYFRPATTEVVGVPEMVNGAAFAAGTIAIVAARKASAANMGAIVPSFEMR